MKIISAIVGAMLIWAPLQSHAATLTFAGEAIVTPEAGYAPDSYIVSVSATFEVFDLINGSETDGALIGFVNLTIGSTEFTISDVAATLFIPQPIPPGFGPIVGPPPAFSVVVGGLIAPSNTNLQVSQQTDDFRVSFFFATQITNALNTSVPVSGVGAATANVGVFGIDPNSPAIGTGTAFLTDPMAPVPLPAALPLLLAALGAFRMIRRRQTRA